MRQILPNQKTVWGKLEANCVQFSKLEIVITKNICRASNKIGLPLKAKIFI